MRVLGFPGRNGLGTNLKGGKGEAGRGGVGRTQTANTLPGLGCSCGGGREGHLWAVAEPGELKRGSGCAGPFPRVGNLNCSWNQ